MRGAGGCYQIAMDRRDDASKLTPRTGALDPFGWLCDFLGVNSASIKVVGQLHKTPWQRFARLQRTAARLAQGKGQPKGVFRFASNEACDTWTANLNRHAK